MSILELTKKGRISIENVYKYMMSPRDLTLSLLQKLKDQELIFLNGGFLEISEQQRLNLATYAIALGADVERTCSLLSWREFEEVAAIAFAANGYQVKRNVRFKHEGRRYEVDVLGFKKPVILCADCKHWYRMGWSNVERIVEKHVERIYAFAEYITSFADKLGLASWGTFKVFPVVLSLISSRFKFCKGVPVVPILQLQNFLSQMSTCIEDLKYFEKSVA